MMEIKLETRCMVNAVSRYSDSTHVCIGDQVYIYNVDKTM